MQTHEQPTSRSKTRNKQPKSTPAPLQQSKTADEIWLDERDVETKRQLANLKGVKPLDVSLISMNMIKSLIDQYPQK